MEEEKKKRRMKLVVQMIIILALILGISTMVWAVTKNNTYHIGNNSNDLKQIKEKAVIGDRVQFNYWLYTVYEQNNHLYCVERNQKLFNNEIAKYNIISKATITGNSATEAKTDAYKYITIEKENITRETKDGKIEHRVIPDFPDGADYANAKLAYILHQYDDKFENKETDSVQNAIWNYMPTWIKYVGKHFEGIVGSSFSNGVKGDTDGYEDIKEAGINYAKKIKLEDKTNHTKIEPIHQANVKNINEGVGLASYVIGPFKWITGEMLNGEVIGSGTINPNAKIKLTDSNGNIIYLEGFDIAIKEEGSDNGTKYYYKKVDSKYGIPSNKDFYIVIPDQRDTVLSEGNLTIKYNSKKDGDNEEESVTNVINNKGIGIKVEMYVENGIVAEIWFLKAAEGTRQNLIYTNTELKPIVIKKESKYNLTQIKRDYTNLQIKKIDASSPEITLPGVKMILKNNDMGDNFYVNYSEGKVTYVERDKATEFVTDQKGIIKVNGLEEGNYTIIELSNPNDGYVLDGDGTYNINIKKGETETVEVEITNTKVNTKISGYVWLDEIEGKLSTKNNLYDNGENLIQDIIVRLVDQDGNRIQETKTDQNGKYIFENVEIAKLDNYQVEFYYNGVKYTNVTQNLKASNGSKAVEKNTDREIFNQNFAIVEGKSKIHDIIKNADGKEINTVIYAQDSGNGIVKLPGMISNSIIKAVTYTDNGKTKINLVNYKNPNNNNEIENINLGLVLREQPDLALISDIYNLRIQINDQSQTYLYGSRFANLDKDTNGFDVGVKFGEKYGSMSYSRPIYHADYIKKEIAGIGDTSKDLKVYITYQIGIQNQATNLLSSVNSIVNYFDTNYKISAIGRTLDENKKVINDTGIVSEEINNKDTENVGMTKQRIDIKTENIESQSQITDIYIEYELNREAVEKIITDKENLNVISEIYSYSTFDGKGNHYAGLDVDSKPGNIDPTYPEKYKEDDSDFAPGIKLVNGGERKITGTVFLDSTKQELMTGQSRLGDGKYTDGETKIAGIKVNLVDKNKNVILTTTTDENGNYVLKDGENENNFIPGNYIVQYVWGDETYNIKDYKSTIYAPEREKEENYWYKQVETRYSDALDDFTLREAVDNGSDETSEMISNTQNMVIGVENNYETFLTGEKTLSEIKNIDFGIVERARQSVGIEKKVSNLKLTLANGQTLIDASLVDGVLKGQNSTQNLMHIPSDATGEGYVKVILDNELTQGAKLEVRYAYVITNLSELEYNNQLYYNFGTVGENFEPLEIQINKVADYLDKDWAVDLGNNTNWEKTAADTNKYSGEDLKLLNETTMLMYEGNESLEPKSTIELTLDASRLLSSSDNIELENEVEIVEVTAPRKIYTSTLGNYIPGKGEHELDDDMAELITVTKPDGANLNYIVPIIIAVASLGIMAVGIIIIRKKVLNGK